MTPETDLSPLPPLTELLPPAQAELLVVADTHLLDAGVEHAQEFASRSKQNARVEVALRVAAGTANPAVHLGDLAQDYPQSPLHAPLVGRAAAQWCAATSRIVFVAGNTDVGDMRDRSCPAAPAFTESVERFRRIRGAGWDPMDVGPFRVITLVTSVFNSGLPLEEQQWCWLERDLAAAGGRRLVLCFHYSLFLRSPEDPGLGNYDVVTEPGRSRLIAQIERFAVEAVFTAHAFPMVQPGRRRACAWGAVDVLRRPGFSELFSSAPPPDRGRRRAESGLPLARVHEEGVRLHHLRTASLRASPADGERPVVTCVPRDIPSSRLAVVVRHPIATFVEVPETFPSVVRQTNRNDCPMLACLELGVRRVRVSAADAAQPDAASGPRTGTLTTLMRRPMGGAELPRWRYGFTTDEVHALDRVMSAAGRSGLRALVGVSDVDGIRAARALSGRLRAIDGFDVVTPVSEADAKTAVRQPARPPLEPTARVPLLADPELARALRRAGDRDRGSLRIQRPPGRDAGARRHAPRVFGSGRVGLGRRRPVGSRGGRGAPGGVQAPGDEPVLWIRRWVCACLVLHPPGCRLDVQGGSHDVLGGSGRCAPRQ